MADFSMNINYPKPQGSSLGDMVNMASGMQQFQQAQQMKPLALEKAQIENQVLRQKNDERLKLQEFTSNPDNWQTNGRIDMDKINAVIPKRVWPHYLRHGACRVLKHRSNCCLCAHCHKGRRCKKNI